MVYNKFRDEVEFHLDNPNILFATLRIGLNKAISELNRLYFKDLPFWTDFGKEYTAIPEEIMKEVLAIGTALIILKRREIDEDLHNQYYSNVNFYKDKYKIEPDYGKTITVPDSFGEKYVSTEPHTNYKTDYRLPFTGRRKGTWEE